MSLKNPGLCIECSSFPGKQADSSCTGLKGMGHIRWDVSVVHFFLTSKTMLPNFIPLKILKAYLTGAERRKKIS